MNQVESDEPTTGNEGGRDRRTFKEKIEDHPIPIVFGALVTGFLAGVGTYKAILTIANLKVIPGHAQVVIENETVDGTGEDGARRIAKGMEGSYVTKLTDGLKSEEWRNDLAVSLPEITWLGDPIEQEPLTVKRATFSSTAFSVEWSFELTRDISPEDGLYSGGSLAAWNNMFQFRAKDSDERLLPTLLSSWKGGVVTKKGERVGLILDLGRDFEQIATIEIKRIPPR